MMKMAESRRIPSPTPHVVFSLALADFFVCIGENTFLSLQLSWTAGCSPQGIPQTYLYFASGDKVYKIQPCQDISSLKDRINKVVRGGYSTIMLVLWSNREGIWRGGVTSPSFIRIFSFIVLTSGVILMSILFITLQPPKSPILDGGKNRTKPAETWYWYVGVPIEVRKDRSAQNHSLVFDHKSNSAIITQRTAPPLNNYFPNKICPNCYNNYSPLNPLLYLNSPTHPIPCTPHPSHTGKILWNPGWLQVR